MARNLIVGAKPDTVAAYEGKLIAGDSVVIVAGGTPASELQKGINDARALFPNNRVHIGCGLKRLPDAAKIEGAELVILDWEPSTVGDRWTWRPAENLQMLVDETQFISGRFGLFLTPSPLMNKALRRQGIRWNFPNYHRAGAKLVILMTQGFVHRSPWQMIVDTITGNTQYEVALDKLKLQYADYYAYRQNLAGQVSMGDFQPAAVNPQTAAVAITKGAKYGINQFYLSGQGVEDNLRLMQILGR